MRKKNRNPTSKESRSKTKESKLTPHAVVVFWLKQTKQRNTKSAFPQHHHKRDPHLKNLISQIADDALSPSNKTLEFPDCRSSVFQLGLIPKISSSQVLFFGQCCARHNNQEGSGDLQEGHPSVTKEASPSSAKHPLKVAFTKTWRRLHLRKASRRLHLRKRRLEGGFKGGFKGAWRGLEGDLKSSEGEGSFERLEGGLKEASRGLQGSFKGASPLEGFKWTWRRLQGALKGLKGGLKPSKGEEGFEGAWRGLQGGLTELLPSKDFKEAWTRRTWRRLQGDLKSSALKRNLKRVWKASCSEGLKAAWYAMDCFGTYFTHTQALCNWCAKCYAMNCLGTYFTHAQIQCNSCSSAAEWIVSTHTLHMPKLNVTRVQRATQYTASVYTFGT